MKDKFCVWKKEDEDYENYNTSCKNYFSFYDEGIKGNNFKYCPFCGRVIKEVQL